LFCKYIHKVYYNMVSKLSITQKATDIPEYSNREGGV